MIYTFVCQFTVQIWSYNEYFSLVHFILIVFNLNFKNNQKIVKCVSMCKQSEDCEVCVNVFDISFEQVWKFPYKNKSYVPNFRRHGRLNK